LHVTRLRAELTAERAAAWRSIGEASRCLPAGCCDECEIGEFTLRDKSVSVCQTCLAGKRFFARSSEYKSRLCCHLLAIRVRRSSQLNVQLLYRVRLDVAVRMTQC
jgi:hypothetical protein